MRRTRFLRVNPACGVCRTVLLRVFVEFRNERSPDMAQIDSVACNGARIVRLSVVLIRFDICCGCANCCKMLFGRKTHLQIAVVWESIGDAPLHANLTLVGKRLSLQRVLLVPKHTVLKLGKLSLLLRFVVPQQRSLSVEIATAATSPCTLSQCEHVRIEVVLVEQLSGVVNIAVVPECYDAACQVVAAHRLIVDAGVEERNEVGIVVEVVGIVETAVDGRNAGLRLATIAPQLSHVNLALLIFPTWIPRNHLLAL